MLCPSCRKDIPDDSAFCQQCGHRIKVTEDSVASEPKPDEKPESESVQKRKSREKRKKKQ